MHFQVPASIRVGIIYLILVLCVLSVTLNIYLFRRERGRAVLLTTVATPDSYGIEIKASRSVLFALQFKKQLYVVTGDSAADPKVVKLFAPSVSEPLDPPAAEGRKEIMITEFPKDFWFINRQLGAW